MASVMLTGRRLLEQPRSPIRVTGTPLPASWLAVAKGIAVLLFALGYFADMSEPFLPLIPSIDDVPGALWALGIRAGAIVGLAMLLTNVAVRAASVAVGVSFMLALLGNQTVYANSVVWCAAMLIVIGLYQDERSHALLRFQFLALYLGSFLSKVVDADWRDGTFMDNWRFDGSARYDAVDEFLGATALFPTLIGWTVIFVEGLLAVLTVLQARSPRIRNVAVAIMLGFHSMPLVLNGLTFGVFYPALALSTVALFHMEPARDISLRAIARDPRLPLVLAVGYGCARLAKTILL